MKKILFLLPALHISLCVFAQGLWTQKASLPDTARGYGIGFSIGNYGYVGLGYSEPLSKGFNSFWQYNPANNTWTKKADFPGHGVTDPATFVIGNKAFVVTGSTDPTDLNTYKDNWEYDANSNTWSQKADFPGVSRTCAIGFSVGNKGYVGTGYDSAGNLYKDIWQYDTSLDKWTKKADFAGSARFGACGFARGGNGYICFGEDFIVGMNIDIWAYDTGTDTWTQKSNCPGDSVYFASGFEIGNNIYAGTGQDGPGYYYNTFWKYNTLTDTWTKQANFMGNPRGCLSTSFSVGDSGYMGLGTNSDIPLAYNDWYKFYPDTITSVNEVPGSNPNFSIFPNPSSGTFYIKFPFNSLIQAMEVFTIIGDKVFSFKSQKINDTYFINLNNQPLGIYILKITSENKTFYSKLIINK